MPNILNKHRPHLGITTLNKLPYKQEVSPMRIHVWHSFDFNLLYCIKSHKSFSLNNGSIFKLYNISATSFILYNVIHINMMLLTG